MTGLAGRCRRLTFLAAAAGVVLGAMLAGSGCGASSPSSKAGAISSPKAAERFEPVAPPKGGGGRR